MELDARSTAIIAIHCQGDVVGPTGALAGLFSQQIRERNVINRIGTVLDAGRRAGCTVVYTRIAFRPDYSDLIANSPILTEIPKLGCMQDGTSSTEIITALEPDPTDILITHKRVGGFTDELHSVFTARGITTVLFSGVATNVSVESTARAATDLGYRVGIIDDACSAATPEAHTAAIASLSVLATITSVGEVTRSLTVLARR